MQARRFAPLHENKMVAVLRGRDDPVHPKHQRAETAMTDRPVLAWCRALDQIAERLEAVWSELAEVSAGRIETARRSHEFFTAVAGGEPLYRFYIPTDTK
jgi:hypothetical protein